MTADFDLDVLDKKPLIDEGGYAWTGWFGDIRTLLVGHRELEFDKSRKTTVLDTRKWLSYKHSEHQIRKREKFHHAAPNKGEETLIYVYEDIGKGASKLGEHQAKRGPKRFTGVFRIEDRGEDWIKAVLVKRDNTG